MDLIPCSSAVSVVNRNILRCKDFTVFHLNRKLPFEYEELRTWAVRAPPAPAAESVFPRNPAVLGVFLGLYKHPCFIDGARTCNLQIADSPLQDAELYQKFRQPRDVGEGWEPPRAEQSRRDPAAGGVLWLRVSPAPPAAEEVVGS